MAPRLPRLQTLILADIENITDFGLFAILRACLQVEHLQAARCPNLLFVQHVPHPTEEVDESGYDSTENTDGEDVLMTDAALVQLDTFPSLKTLILISQPTAGDAAKLFPQLVSLQLTEVNDTTLTDQGFQMLSQVSVVDCSAMYNVRLTGNVSELTVRSCPRFQSLTCSHPPSILRFTECAGPVALSCPMTNLKMLELESCHEQFVSSLHDLLLESDATLKSLSLAHTAVTSQLLSGVTTFALTSLRLRDVKGLIRLDLNAETLSELVLEDLADLIDLNLRCSCLRTVTISRCPKISADAFISLSTQCPNIQEVAVNSCRMFTEIGIEHLALHSALFDTLILNDCPWVHKLQLASASLRVLRINACGELTIVALQAPNLVECTISGCLRLNSIDIAASEAHKYARIASCSALTKVSLNSVGLRELRCAETPQLKELLLNAPNLYSLQISRAALNFELLSHLVSQCPQLAVLSVSNLSELQRISIVSSSIERLHLAQSRSLTELHLECPRLKTLQISWCARLRDAALAAALKGAPNLEVLYLMYCVAVVGSWEAALADHSRLQTVILRACNGLLAYKLVNQSVSVVTIDRCDKLKQVAVETPALRMLRLQGCRVVESATVKSEQYRVITSSCPKLSKGVQTN
eukprot:TRINITY_DN6197_c0_g2_i1.p1 TRINITY_DN6197_c0_g2~~TRINITY_DN6197_c0_g2_i1.p1  ORF type:complete len:642 (+),score=127.48 TRINITY_DN6197_c0_g2_i1:308-2233(+)